MSSYNVNLSYRNKIKLTFKNFIYDRVLFFVICFPRYNMQTNVEKGNNKYQLYRDQKKSDRVQLHVWNNCKNRIYMCETFSEDPSILRILNVDLFFSKASRARVKVVGLVRSSSWIQYNGDQADFPENARRVWQAVHLRYIRPKRGRER